MSSTAEDISSRPSRQGSQCGWAPGRKPPASCRPGVGRVLIVVALVAVGVNVLSLCGSQLWAFPDSLRYVTMAVDIAEGLDFSSESFVLRTPGYPALLACIFRLFESQSSIAILIVQHAMVVATALLVTMTAWRIAGRGSIALLSGVLCACSLQLLAYANVIMSEVPYTLALIMSVYFLVTYHRVGQLRFLALASLMAGVSYLFRPTGLTIVALCILAGIHRTLTPLVSGEERTDATPAACRSRSMRCGWHSLIACVLAVGPALAVVVPCTIHNAMAHDGQLLNHSMGLALYHRTARFDRLEAPDSAALAEIREVMDEAKRRGALGPNAEIDSWGAVYKAYQAVQDASFAEAGEKISRAAWDMVWANPRLVADRTIRYAAWMLLVPDSTYRFQPGGAKGKACKRDAGADIFDIGLYQSDPEPYGDGLRSFARYVPLSTRPRATTPLVTAVTRWFYHRVDAGPPIVGAIDSPYQAYVMLCALGGLCSLLARQRMTWLLIGGVIATQVLGSAFLGGPTPRYGVPVHPLMNLYGALVLAAIVRAMAPVIRTAFGWRIGRNEAQPSVGAG